MPPKSSWFAATNGGGGACTAAGGWPNSSTDNATFDANSGGGTITRNVNWTVGLLNPQAFTGTLGKPVPPRYCACAAVAASITAAAGIICSIPNPSPMVVIYARRQPGVERINNAVARAQCGRSLFLLLV